MNFFIGRIWQEFRTIFADGAVVITIIGGALFYAALYPQPYLNDLPRDVELAVIDHDRSATSRRMIRWVDATPEVAVVRSVDSVEEARELIQSREVHGFFFIRRGFEAAIARRQSPVLAVAGDANYFLLDSNVIEGVVAAARELGSTVRAERLVLSGMPTGATERSRFALTFEQIALFNPSMGYLSYVLPAMFVLILHQTLLLAAGLIGASGQGPMRADKSAGGLSPQAELGARFIALFLIYVLLVYLYFDVGFSVYGIEQTAGRNDLMLMIVAFVAAAVSAGLAFGAALPRRELAAPIVMVTSLPLVFSAGFVWPLEMIPETIRSASLAFPSTSAIQGFLKLNQMGAEFRDVLNHWLLLIMLAIGYFLLAVKLQSRRQRRESEQ